MSPSERPSCASRKADLTSFLTRLDRDDLCLHRRSGAAWRSRYHDRSFSTDRRRSATRVGNGRLCDPERGGSGRGSCCIGRAKTGTIHLIDSPCRRSNLYTEASREVVSESLRGGGALDSSLTLTSDRLCTCSRLLFPCPSFCIFTRAICRMSSYRPASPSKAARRRRAGPTNPATAATPTSSSRRTKLEAWETDDGEDGTFETTEGSAAAGRNGRRTVKSSSARPATVSRALGEFRRLGRSSCCDRTLTTLP